MESSASEFYFELSANGEHTKFQEVEGVSTEVVLRRNLNPGEIRLSFGYRAYRNLLTSY